MTIEEVDKFFQAFNEHMTTFCHKYENKISKDVKDMLPSAQIKILEIHLVMMYLAGYSNALVKEQERELEKIRGN